jgi:hypothetical protein
MQITERQLVLSNDKSSVIAAIMRLDDGETGASLLKKIASNQISKPLVRQVCLMAFESAHKEKRQFSENVRSLAASFLFVSSNGIEGLDEYMFLEYLKNPKQKWVASVKSKTGRIEQLSIIHLAGTHKQMQSLAIDHLIGAFDREDGTSLDTMRLILYVLNHPEYNAGWEPYDKLFISLINSNDSSHTLLCGKLSVKYSLGRNLSRYGQFFLPMSTWPPDLQAEVMPKTHSDDVLVQKIIVIIEDSMLPISVRKDAISLLEQLNKVQYGKTITKLKEAGDQILK